jgi:hypothetical protein
MKTMSLVFGLSCIRELKLKDLVYQEHRKTESLSGLSF